MRERLAETLNRTVKLEVDDGASTIAEAEEIARSHVLQVVVGGGVVGCETAEALLLTVLNTGPRAFIGGVHVLFAEDFLLAASWNTGMSLSETIMSYGAERVSTLSANHPTIVVGGSLATHPGSVVVHPTWNGWAGGVVRKNDCRLAENQEFTPSGVLAGAIAVGEAFQHIRGAVMAGHRDVGVSLWDLSIDWRDEGGVGPKQYYLPASVWLAGLGHLGQSYAWVLGMLPYPDRSALTVTLQDVDALVEANAATAVLAQPADLPKDGQSGERKTRLVGRRLEVLGVKTVLVERLFDEHMKRQAKEPIAILGGFDRPEPRRTLEGAGFSRIFDAGLGGGVRSYLDMIIHTFPSHLSAEDAFSGRGGLAPVGEREAYEALLQELIETGMAPDEARCGIVEEIAGRSIAVAFVGAVAATIVIAEVLRDLFGAPRSAFVDISLRDLPGRRIVAAPEVEPVSYGSITSS
jgi:hypothetical protein